MKYLIEIARILERSRGPQSRIIRPLDATKSRDKVSRLYQAARSGEFTTDASASQALFSVEPQNVEYAVVKSRLKRRMLNTVITLDLSKGGFSRFAQAQYACHRGVFVMQALLMLGARSVARRVAKKVLLTSSRYGFSKPKLEALLNLRVDASIRGDYTAFKRLSTEISSCAADVAAETEVYRMFLELDLAGVKRAMPSREARQLAETYASVAEELANTCSTLDFSISYYRLLVYAESMKGNHRRTSEICDKAFDYFSGLSTVSTTVYLSEFSFRKLEACLFLRDYVGGRDAVARGLGLVNAGSNNWFFFNQTFVLLLLNTQQFEEAHSLISEVRNHPRFTMLPQPQIEYWEILRRFSDFANDQVVLRDDQSGHSIRAAKLDSVLRLASTLKSDKQGHKVSLLILHILYLLEIGDFDGIIDRMEALRLYRARYLKTAQFPKTASFFKLLTIMENNSFSYKLVKEKGEKEYQKLLESNENQEEINEGLQILPYDWLWQKILERLKEYEEANAKKVVY